MTINITYQGEQVTVVNSQTMVGLESIEELAKEHPELLFVCEPVRGKRYAYDMRELEDYITKNDSLYNFYSPRNIFTENDIKQLMLRSPIITAYVRDYLQNNKELELISPETLDQMNLFLDGVSEMNISNDRQIETIKKNYSAEELEDLRKAGVSMSDLLLRDAYENFKSYYTSLSLSEKNAMDSLPIVKRNLATYSLGDSIKNIFSLPPEACIGGIAGICRLVINAADFYNQLKDILLEVEGQPLVKETQKTEEKTMKTGFFDTLSGFNKFIKSFTEEATQTTQSFWATKKNLLSSKPKEVSPDKQAEQNKQEPKKK